MSRVERIELFHVEVPCPKPFYPSWIPGYPQTHSRSTLLRVTTDDGLVGVSAGMAFSRERQGLGDLLGGFLIGIEATDLDTVRKRLREASYLGWRNWWIEAAFWDLLGQVKGVPVYKLLQAPGHEQDVTSVGIYASSGEVRDFEARKPWLDDIRSKGIGGIKIRVKDPAMENDLEILREVRREVGQDLKVAVDANQGWPVSLFDPTPSWSLDYATEFGRGCDDLGIAWIEEPLDMHDWEGMRELRSRISTPVAGGELHGDWHEVRALFDNECLDKYQPDATFCGGLEVARRVMDECRHRNLSYSPHTWTMGIGLVINLHAFAAWEHHEDELLEYPYEPPGWIPEVRDGVLASIEVGANGTISVPQKPGLGLELDPASMRRFARRFYVATPARVALRTIREKGLRTALELKRKKSSAESTQ